MMAVRLAKRIEMAAGTHAIAGTAIAFFVHVKAVFGIRFQPAQIGLYSDLVPHCRESHCAGSNIATRWLELCGRYWSGRNEIRATS